MVKMFLDMGKYRYDFFFKIELFLNVEGWLRDIWVFLLSFWICVIKVIVKLLWK